MGEPFSPLRTWAPSSTCLAAGHPDWCGEALHARRHPQRQNVDAGVGLAVVTQRSRDAAGGMFGVPWPDPRPHAVFEGGDDLRGDATVHVLLGRLFGLSVVVDGVHAGLLSSTLTFALSPERESKLNPVGKRRTARAAGGRAGGTNCTGSPVTAVLARPVRDRRPKHAHWPRARKPALDDDSEGESQGRRQSSP